MVFFEKHCCSARFNAPQSSVHDVYENCVLSKRHSLQIDLRHFWSVHLATKSIIVIVVTSPLYNKLILMPGHFINQSEPEEPEKQFEEQIAEKNVYSLSDMDLEDLQRVWFWIKTFTTRQTLNHTNLVKIIVWRRQVSQNHFLARNIFKREDFDKRHTFRKSRFDSTYPVTTPNFLNFVVF